MLRISSVSAVVLDVEADRRHGHTKRNRQRQCEPPSGRGEYKQTVRDTGPGEDDCRFQIHLRTIAPALPGAQKMSVDLTTKRALKSVVGAELQLTEAA